MVKSIRRLLMHRIIRFVLNADVAELTNIIHAVHSRYQTLYSDWDIIYLALPKNNPAERKRLLQNAVRMVTEE